jgi:hypothetical protein
MALPSALMVESYGQFSRLLGFSSQQFIRRFPYRQYTFDIEYSELCRLLSAVAQSDCQRDYLLILPDSVEFVSKAEFKSRLTEFKRQR